MFELRAGPLETTERTERVIGEAGIFIFEKVHHLNHEHVWGHPAKACRLSCDSTAQQKCEPSFEREETISGHIKRKSQETPGWKEP